MRTYSKIDFYFNGDYYTTTEQSKTCKEALARLVKALEERSHKMGGLGVLDAYVLKHKGLLKARKARK